MRPYDTWRLFKQANEATGDKAPVAVAVAGPPALTKRAPLPYALDHPYLHAMTQSGVGTVLGGVAGGLAGYGGARLFKNSDAARVLGPLSGAYAGAVLGGLAGHGHAVLDHYQERTAYSESERAAGRSGQLPLSVQHPYLTATVLAGVGGPMVHYYEKTRMPDAE